MMDKVFDSSQDILGGTPVFSSRRRPLLISMKDLEAGDPRYRGSGPSGCSNE